jgi:hypothetical protein
MLLQSQEHATRDLLVARRGNSMFGLGATNGDD